MTQLAISQENLELLDALGTGENPHSRRTLKDHLIGTYDLLVDWGSANQVALGGLFHSIYGTQVYRIQSEDLSNRSRIAAAIGEKAEELAYLFCVTERRGFFYEAGKSKPMLWDYVHDRLIDTTNDMLRDLIEIEIANVIEQVDVTQPAKAQSISNFKHLLARGKPFMSASACAALEEFIGSMALEG